MKSSEIDELLLDAARLDIRIECLLAERADLLAACEAYVACDQRSGGEYVRALAEARAQIRAAITKARGE